MAPPLGSAISGALGGGGVIGRAVVELVGDSAKLQKDVVAAQAQVEKSTGAQQAATSKWSTAWKVGALVAAAAVLRFGAAAVGSFMEAQQVAAQTENVIRSTGGAAGVSADQVAGLAGRMQDYSGVQDEVIQGGQNLLLTFTAIQNQAGANNDIFNQASRITLDMAVALNQGSLANLDLKSTTIQVGKALQDPIRGMTALRRVGVNFSDAQAEVIATLVESGDLLGAQKLILAELRTEFGGAARAAGDTFAGKMAKLGAEWDDVMEKIGGGIVSVLLPAADAFLKVVDAVDRVGGAIGKVGEQIDKVSLLEWAAEISGATTLVPDFEAALVGALRSGQISIDDAREATRAFNAEIATIDYAGKASIGTIIQLAGGFSTAGQAAREGTDENVAWAESARLAADAAREERLALLGLAGGLLGIEAAAIDAAEGGRELRAAQAEVNRLTENGKQGTAAYREALRALREAQLNAVQSQLSLREAVFQYAQEAVDSGQSTRAAKELIRDLGRDAGLSAQDVQGLIRRIEQYRAGIEGIPKSVTTTLTIKVAGANVPISQITGGTAAGGILAGQHGFVTRGPTVLVGEGRAPTFAGRGAEGVIPFDARGIGILSKALEKAGGGGRGLTIGRIEVHVEARDLPADSPALARRVADALYGMLLDEVRT
jgi:hypothetical protein